MHRYALILHIAAVNLAQWQIVLWITLSFFKKFCKSVKNECAEQDLWEVVSKCREWAYCSPFTWLSIPGVPAPSWYWIMGWTQSECWVARKAVSFSLCLFFAWCVSLFSVWPSEIDVFTWHHTHAGCSHLLIRTVWHSQADAHTDAHDSSCTSFPVASQRCVFDHHIFQFK